MAILAAYSFDDVTGDQYVDGLLTSVLFDTGTDTPSNYGRAIRIRQLFPPQVLLPSMTTDSEIFLSFWAQGAVLGSNVKVDFRSSGGVVQFNILMEDNGSISVRSGDTATQIASGSVPIWQSGYVHFQIYAKISTTVGEVRIRQDGATSDDFVATGLNTNAHSGNTSIASSTFFPLGFGSEIRIDDVIFSSLSGSAPTSWPGRMRVVSLMPTGAGDQTQLPLGVGSSNWQAVSQRPHDGDTTYLNGATAGLADLYQLENLGITYDGSIYGIQPYSIWYVFGGSMSLSSKLKSGSSTADYNAHAYSGGTYKKTPAFILSNDPNTSAPWTSSALDALQAGPSITSYTSGTAVISAAGVEVIGSLDAIASGAGARIIWFD